MTSLSAASIEAEHALISATLVAVIASRRLKFGTPSRLILGPEVTVGLKGEWTTI